MLTGGDEYPLHQMPEPVALVIDRNFYDRFFYNGYSPDGRIFFAAAMGVYPALDVIDGAFCVMIDGVQHNLRASGRLNGERLAMRVGPLSVSVDVPLSEVTLRVAANADSPLSAELHITARHFPIEEPRFTRRIGTRLWMDYTRMTQNGRWSGWIEVAGVRHAIGPKVTGTRDRSWGIRPVGKADSQPAPQAVKGDQRWAGPQFFWLWTPCNFGEHSVYLHTNDDGAGLPWNRRAVLWADGGLRGEEVDFEAPAIAYDWEPGTRRVRRAVCQLGPETRLTLTPVSPDGALEGSGTRGHFYMNGLGYTHPEWGHGMDHGDLEVAYDVIDGATVADGDFANLHIQAVAEAVLEHEGRTYHGRGVVEQMFVGPHGPSGLTGLFDPVAA
jgi:hypothetical protein